MNGLNALISQGGTGVPSPIQRYQQAKQQQQSQQMNALSMQSTQQQMGIRGKAEGRAQQDQKLKFLAPLSKAVLEAKDKPTAYKQALKYAGQYMDTSQMPQEYSPEVDAGLVSMMKAGGLEMDAPKETWKQGTSPSGAPMQQSSVSGLQTPGVTPKKSGQTINIGDKPDSKYWEERLKGQAAKMSDIEKGAEASYNEMVALDRFLESSKGTTEGGAQPIISGVKNFLTSFGAEFSDLKDIAQMEQAIGDIKVNFFKEFGARGLTDKDMEIIKDSLPRLSVSQEARENVVSILKKAHSKKIKNYEKSVEEEQRVYPSQSGKVFVPGWYGDYQKYSSPAEQSNDLTPEEVEELSARESMFQQGGFNKVTRSN